MDEKYTMSSNQSSMKVLKVGVPALIVLMGLGIVGGSYFIGSYVENNHQKWVSELNEYLVQNELLAEAGVATEVKIIDFKRGVFSSDVNFRVRLNDEISIDGSSKVFHGPLPTNRFIPSLASIETQMDMPNKLKEFFNEKILAKGTTDISFSNNVSGDLVLSEFEMKDNSDVVKVSPIKWVYRYSPESENTENQIDVDRMNVRTSIGQLLLDKLSFNANIIPTKGYTYANSGNSSVEIKNLELRSSIPMSDISDMKLGDIKLGGIAKLNGTRLESDYQLSMGSTSVNGLDFGKLNFELFSDVDAEIYERLINDWVDGKGLNQKLFEELALKKPALQIKKLALENKGGNAHLDMGAKLDIDRIPTKEPSEEEVLKAFSGSHINIDLDRDYLVEAVKNFSILSGQDTRSASNEATQKIRQLFAGAELANRFFNVKDNRLSFKLELNQRDVIVNAEKLSDKEILTAQQLISKPESLFNKIDVENWSNGLSFDTSALESELAQRAERKTVESSLPDVKKEVEEELVIEERPVIENVEVSQPQEVASSNLNAACQLQAGMDDVTFLQACLSTSPSEEQIQEIIAEAKNLGSCTVAQRLYANKGQSNPRIAFAYAKEYDPQFAGSNSCFNANKNTAVYWYEATLEMEPSNSEARTRLMELRK